jgi:hypothetical protein
MQRPNSPSIITFLPVTLFLMLVGWGGLAALVWYTPPTVWPRWLFFFLNVLAFTGTAIPLVAFLNIRFPSAPPASVGTVMRQALWVGVYIPTLEWLRIPRVLSPTLAMLVAAAFIAAEALLRIREHSQWRP